MEDKAQNIFFSKNVHVLQELEMSCYSAYCLNQTHKFTSVVQLFPHSFIFLRHSLTVLLSPIVSLLITDPNEGIELNNTFLCIPVFT